MNILTREQSHRLRRFAERVAMCCRERYTVKVLHVQPWTVCAGQVEIIARTKVVYERLMRMVQRIAPELKLAYEHGRGWHYMDKTEYHYGWANYMLERD